MFFERQVADGGPRTAAEALLTSSEACRYTAVSMIERTAFTTDRKRVKRPGRLVVQVCA